MAGGARATEAVIFDLYGTLVGEFMGPAFEAMLDEMAAALGADTAGFRRAWHESAVERQTGRLGDARENVRVVCERAGGEPNDDGVDAATAIRDAVYRGYFVPKPDAEATLRRLRDDGHRLGLISMCAPDTPALWKASPLAPLVDVATFSSLTGLRKPDPEIYLHTTTTLGVDPRACVFVGDGSYGELAGAEAVGMRAVLIRHDAEEALEVVRPQDEPWDGASISALAEVFDFVTR